MKNHVRPRRLLLVAAALLCIAGAAHAEGVLELAGSPGRTGSVELRSDSATIPIRQFRSLPETSIHRLGALTLNEAATLRGDRTVESRSDATRVGIIRAFSTSIGFDPVRADSKSDIRLNPSGGHFATASTGNLVWTSGFVSEGAGAVRLLLENVTAPAGTVAFVYSAEGETHGPYPLGGDIPRDVWTNAVFSPEVFLEIQFPSSTVDASRVSLSISSVAHMEHQWFAPSRTRVQANTEALAQCFEDIGCVSSADFPELDNASRAVAQISYREGSSIFVCSGALVNTTVGTGIPYFLTANHCVSDSQTASTVEAYWDYRTPSCENKTVTRSNLARTLGATLVVTGSKAKSKADYTLLELSQTPPPGRYYLGWSAQKEDAAGGKVLYRIAHPEGGPQSFSVHRVSETPTPGACDGLPTTRFIYSKNVEGATQGGSSGSPLFTRDGLKVVGQLFGRCGRNLDDACDVASNSAVDGAFWTYFEEIKQYLAPPEKQRCSPNAETLCLSGAKFKVNVVARDPRSGRGTTGTAIPQNDVFGYFSLPELTGQSENPEIFIKIVDGTPVNGKFWVFYGGLTDLEFVLEVTDMESGVRRVYSKDAGGYCGNSDTSAF